MSQHVMGMRLVFLIVAVISLVSRPSIT